ncbi:MAG: MarR family transcriptional regulator [Chitinophagales bacterium]|nr:MarR family transcriptional regulator [Chitinophagales bacterium]
MKYEQLKLENQLCFPVYAASRLITRAYQPYLNELGITYPQYLVLLVLWEEDNILVNDIARKLILNTNTITPLLKRMEQQGLVERKRSEVDERKVCVLLTEEGEQLKATAALIPQKVGEHLVNAGLEVDDLLALKDSLNSIISFLSK